MHVIIAYDISDNLSMEVRPQITQTAGPDGLTNNLGFSMSFNF